LWLISNFWKLDSWRIEKDNVLQLLEKIKAAGTPLGEYVGGRFYRGILTGFNEAFVVEKATKDDLIKQHASSAEVLKPFLRGRDVKRWKIENPELWLIFTRRGIDIKKYPAIKKHLEQFRTQLEPGKEGGRKAGSYEWYEIQDNIAYWEEFETPKIIYPNITEQNTFAWDDKNFYANQKTFIIPEASKYLLGILNSRVGYYVFEHMMSKLQNGFFEPSAIFMKNFPIPTPSSAVSSLITNLVNGILLATSQSTPQGLLVAYLEQIINALVYELYLPDVLHSAGRFPSVVISADPPPDLPSLENLQAYYQRTYDPKHEIRKLVFYLEEIPEIRIIAGKV
jgi:adenine-specific DNA-methyltransferase